MKNACFFLALLCVNLICSQEFTITGKLKNDQGKALESATVYVESVKDSSIISYSISNKLGQFTLAGSTKEQKATFWVTYTGMDPIKKELDLTQSKISLGDLTLSESAEELSEVVVTASRAPIQIKKDTLQFNAASFKTGADANVETLLKKLPGVTVDKEGNITVNGKKVSKILVNGKEFFGNDPKIATKNLPKEIIDKIQVVDTKTKEQAFTGEEGNKEEKTINITIKKDKNKGLFGRITSGFGTNERYEHSGILNYFNDKERLSILGGANNVNTSGFNSDEVKDMGGGRYNYVRVNGVWTSTNPLTFGATDGITKSATAGIHYANEWGKTRDLTTDYFFSDRNTKTASTTSSETFLPNNESFQTIRKNSSDRIGKGHNFNLEFEIKPDSLTRISVQPKLVKEYGDNYSNSFSERSELSNLVNNSTSNTSSNYNNTSGGIEFRISRKLKHKGEYFNVSLGSDISDSKSDDIFQSDINYFDTTTPDENIDQLKINRSESYDLGANIRMAKKIKGNWFYEASLRAELEESKRNRKTFDFNFATNSYDLVNLGLTNDFKTNTSSLDPQVGLKYRNDSLSVGFRMGYNRVNIKNKDLINNSLIDKVYHNLSYRLSLWKRFGPGKSLWLSINNNTWTPLASQLQPLVDNSNPLNIVQGNPNLRNGMSNNININYNHYDMKSKSGYGGYVYFGLVSNGIVSKSTIDDNLVRFTTYENVDGNINLYSDLHYDKKYKLDKHRLSWRVNSFIEYRKEKAFSQEVLFTTKTLSIGPKLSLTYNYNDFIEVSPSYLLNVNNVNYSIDTDFDSDFNSSELGITLETFWPKWIEFSNDFRMIYNPNVADGFTQNFYMWNASLGVKFLKNDRAMFKMKIFDLLDQNTAVSRVSRQDYIEDSQRLVLEQYFMFSLTYKVSKFKGNKKK